MMSTGVVSPAMPTTTMLAVGLVLVDSTWRRKRERVKTTFVEESLH